MYPFKDEACLHDSRFQTVVLEGRTIVLRSAGKPEERHTFSTLEEAAGRAAIIAEALDWIGTPFLDCADIKGPKGGVDCAMLCARVFIDTGRVAPFDPRPYSPDQMRNSPDELCLKWIQEKLGGREVEQPRVADVAIWHFGLSHSHFGIVVNGREVVHAFKRARMVMMTPMDADFLRFESTHKVRFPRPVKYFDAWSA